jgi:hypothetical protein
MALLAEVAPPAPDVVLLLATAAPSEPLLVPEPWFVFPPQEHTAKSVSSATPAVFMDIPMVL